MPSNEKVMITLHIRDVLSSELLEEQTNEHN